ncbi:MAG: M56 family metallopeptidase [Clostridia bacterium]|nr:M56 family metallopeptidase [Clostridia bacterium]
MEAWLKTLLICTLTTGAVSALLILLAPLLSRRYRQSTVYALLLIALVGFLIPWRPTAARPAVVVQVPDVDTIARRIPFPTRQASVDSIVPASYPTVVQTGSTAAVASSAPLPVRQWLASFALIIWGAGAAVVLIRELTGYARYRRVLRRWQQPASEPTKRLLLAQAERMGLRKAPALVVSPAASSPLVTGLVHPTVYLPHEEETEEDLVLILRHELTHYRRGDLFVKWLTLFACALHWMNPAVWALKRELNQYCETSCDERVMSGCDGTERRRYSETIIASIQREKKTGTALCTGFQGGLKRMKRRILSIMDTRKKKWGVLLTALILCLTVGAGALLTVATRSGETARAEGSSVPYPASSDGQETEPISFVSPTPLLLALSTPSPAQLPPLPENYQDEVLEEFDVPYSAVTIGGVYGSAPAYNFYDDPEWPASLYSPGVRVQVTGRIWRAEHIEDVTGEGGMVWLRVNILDGETIQDAYMPEAFLKLNGAATLDFPTAAIHATDGTGFVNVSGRVYEMYTFSSLPDGAQVEIVSYTPGLWQIRGAASGYVPTENLTVDEATMKRFAPDYVDGFDSIRLGYMFILDNFNAWFDEMEKRYGSKDFWTVELNALRSQTQLSYGLVDTGDTFFCLPGENDWTQEEAIAHTKALLSLDDGTDENGIPHYAFHCRFSYSYGVESVPYWTVSATATHNDGMSYIIQYSPDGEVQNRIENPPAKWRLEAVEEGRMYNELALMQLYGDMTMYWPNYVRVAYDPESFPPLEEGQLNEDQIRQIALDALAETYGEEKRDAVSESYSTYLQYYTFSDGVYWVVRFVNLDLEHPEELRAEFTMDGQMRGEWFDDIFESINDYQAGGNG